MVAALVANWRKRHKPQTAYNYRSKLRQVLRLLEDYGAPRIVPPKVPIPHARAVIASGDEIARLFKQPTPWLRLYMLLYFQCGLRSAEALRVTPRSWNREEHTVTIEVKGGGTRTAQITRDVELIFEACGEPEKDTPFLHIVRGRPITAAGLKFAWQKHRAACGVSPLVTAHDLRRTAATILYNATHDLRVPQQLLGHKNLASTLQYLAPMAPDEARKYFELLRFDKFHTEIKQ
jgi:integrase